MIMTSPTTTVLAPVTMAKAENKPPDIIVVDIDDPVEDKSHDKDDPTSITDTTLVATEIPPELCSIAYMVCAHMININRNTLDDIYAIDLDRMVDNCIFSCSRRKANAAHSTQSSSNVHARRKLQTVLYFDHLNTASSSSSPSSISSSSPSSCVHLPQLIVMALPRDTTNASIRMNLAVLLRSEYVAATANCGDGKYKVAILVLTTGALLSAYWVLHMCNQILLPLRQPQMSNIITFAHAIPDLRIGICSSRERNNIIIYNLLKWLFN